jgi:DNA-binding Lrp family transcriptional regulator
VSTRRNYGGKTKREADRITETYKALELRAQGLSVDEIAEELNVSPATAHRRLDRGLRDLPAQSLEALRGESELRINAAMREVGVILFDSSEPAETRLKAVDRLVRLEERRARLLGLDEPKAVTEALARAELGLEG